MLAKLFSFVFVMAGTVRAPVPGAVPEGSCSTRGYGHDRIHRFSNQPPLTDEQNLREWTRFGHICCLKSYPILQLDQLIEKSPFYSYNGCNNMASPTLQFRIFINESLARTEQTSCQQAYVDFPLQAWVQYVPCEIQVKGDLKGYIDRTRPCTYNPVLALSCNASNGQVGRKTYLNGTESPVIDQNTPPKWSAETMTISVSEFATADTMVLFPKPALLSVSENSDIWGSANWRINLKLVDLSEQVGNSKLYLDDLFVVQADPDIPSSQNVTVPALRLRKRIPHDSCFQNNCSFSFQVVATDGDGLSSAVNITLQIIDENNHPPVFEPSPDAIQIHSPQQIIKNLTRVSAIDGDKGINCTITYSLTTGHDLFSINKTSGIISMEKVIVMKEYTPDFHIVTVKAHEDASTNPNKCSHDMIAFKAIVFHWDRAGAPTTDLATEPSILRVKKENSRLVILGYLMVRENGVEISAENFIIRVKDERFMIDRDGTILKLAGHFIQESTFIRVEVLKKHNQVLFARDISVIAE